MGPNPEVSDEVQTRSSRQRATRQHTLERVRNNQRRHRARRREYIAEVARKLAEAEHLVSSFQGRVETLEAELDLYRKQGAPSASGVSPFSLTNARVSPHTLKTGGCTGEQSTDTAVHRSHQHVATWC